MYVMRESTPDMERRIQESPQALSGRRMARAALIVMIAYIASGVLGLVRQAVISATFGAAVEFDAFVAAQRVPELLFNLVAGGALGSAFIPVFSGFLAKHEEERAWRLVGAVVVLLTVGAILLSAVTFAAAPWLVSAILRPADPPEQQALIVDLLRIMLSTVIIFGVSGLLMGILNAYQHFWRPAAALSLYNLGIIFGAVVLAPSMGVYGLAWGTVIGALLHLGIQLPELPRIGARWRPSLDIRTPGVLEVLTLMGPRIVGQGVVQVNFVVITAFTSGMVDGSLAIINNAFILMFTALGIIGQSLGTAVFPSLSTLAAQEDWPGYRRTLSGALRSVLFLAIPASVGLIVLAQPLVALLFERRAWSPEATAGAAWALQFFAVGLVGHALLEILARAFYALHDTWTPVKVGVGTMLVNIALDVVLIRVIGVPGDLARGPFAGLALAMSVATAIEAAALWLILRRRIGGMDGGRVWALVWRTLAAAGVMGLALWALQVALPGVHVLIITALGAALGAAIFFALALALGLEEARAVPAMVLRRLGR